MDGAFVAEADQRAAVVLVAAGPVVAGPAAVVAVPDVLALVATS